MYFSSPCSRPQNLKITIDSLLSHMPARGHTLYISQDGDDPEVRRISQEYQSSGKAKYLNFHYQQPANPSPEAFRFPSYFKIAQHYQWALGQIFDVLGHEKVIIIEGKSNDLFVKGIWMLNAHCC